MVLPSSRVHSAYKLVSFMLHHKMTANVQKQYYSYWQTITQNKPLSRVRKLFNDPQYTRGKIQNPVRMRLIKS